LRLVGLLLIATAMLLALSRAPDVPVEGLVARWAPPPSDFVELRGMVVHLRDEGRRDDPEPLLLLHGTGASLHTWDGWARELRHQRRVIRVDLPGFGLTGPFGGEYDAEDYRGDTYARFVLDLLDQLGVQRAVLAGNSLGGEIAWRVATLAPARVSRLVLVDASGLDFRPEEIPPAFLMARLPVLRTIGQAVLPRELVAASVASVYGDPRRVTPELVDRYWHLTLREGNRAALSLRLQQLEPGAAAGRLGQIAVPTLILWGERDKLIPPAVGEDLQRRIPGSQRVLLPGLGHVPQEEDPAASLQPVLAFLGLAPRPGAAMPAPAPNPANPTQ
jgi:pimeloyl-ACP methyl ester carboxylesterase